MFSYQAVNKDEISCQECDRRIIEMTVTAIFLLSIPMTATTTKNLYTFEEYLQYDDPDNRYELVNGRFEVMTPPTFLHILICDLIRDVLKAEIDRLQLPLIATRETGIRTGLNKSRIADLCVLSKEQVMNSLSEAGICSEPPVLAIEVVSQESIKRDYRYKRSEYAATGVGEYWIVDPIEQQVTILVLDEGLYEESLFTDEQELISPTFAETKLTPQQIFAIDV